MDVTFEQVAALCGHPVKRPVNVVIGETEPAFYRRRHAEQAKTIGAQSRAFSAVYLLLAAALVIAVRHGLADDVEEALEMIEDEARALFAEGKAA